MFDPRNICLLILGHLVIMQLSFRFHKDDVFVLEEIPSNRNFQRMKKILLEVLMDFTYLFTFVPFNRTAQTAPCVKIVIAFFLVNFDYNYSIVFL